MARKITVMDADVYTVQFYANGAWHDYQYYGIWRENAEICYARLVSQGMTVRIISHK